MARPRFQPTAKDRQTVSQLAAFGVPIESMGAFILDAKGKPISMNTVTKYFREEIASGAAKANAKVAQTLYAKAIQGDTVSMIFWLKTRARWREVERIDVSVNPGSTSMAVLSTAEIVKAVKAINGPRDEE